MAESITYNMDCMDFLKTVPDKYYDIAVVDPPFGSGLADNGGCKGWFTKYHQDTELEVKSGDRFDGGRYKKYRDQEVPAYNRFGSPGSRFEKHKNTVLVDSDILGGGRTSHQNRRNMG